MKHKFGIIWHENLKIWHCIRCGFETIDLSIDENSKCAYWYKIHTIECVLCGKGGTYRERVYGKKPTDYHEIYEFEQYLCGDHYLTGF